jgi:RNA polymerase sigma factor (sigma-70 family)
MAGDPIQRLYFESAEKWPLLMVPYPRFRERVLASRCSAENLAGPDLYLAVALESGSSAAWECFHTKYAAFIQKHVAQVDSRREFVEDATQDLLEQMPQRIRKYRGLSSIYGWLAVVAANHARNRKITTSRETSLDSYAVSEERETSGFDRLVSDHGDAAREMADHLDRSECEKLIRGILQPALRSLRPDWRMLLMHKFRDGMTNREIARIVLKTGEANVSKRLSKALRQLNKRILSAASRMGSTARKDLEHCVELLGR